MFDLSRFNEYREDNRMEVKKAEGGLPNSLWDSYSAFANCYGGIIILGVKELKNGSWITTGLENAHKLVKDFWNLINNSKKVSINLLRDEDVQVYNVCGNTVIVINVPRAKREQRPVYINDNLWGGTFRRNGEGDYHCTRSEIKAMLRDQTEETTDMRVINFFSLSDLNQDTIKAYRNYHQNTKEGHPFTQYNDKEYLRSIGAAAISESDSALHPTGAGLLMFGNDYDIVREYPEYFLDYQEHLDPNIRWTDRLESTSGTNQVNAFLY